MSTAASARRLDTGVLGMTLFLYSEAMFFAGLISALLVLQAQQAAWPPPGQPRLPVAVTGVNTVVLILSGLAMSRAAGAIRGGGAGGASAGVSGAARWLAVTATLGALFLLVQGYEWVRLVAYGLTTSSGVYGATFYTLVGAHGAHVLAALAAVAVVDARTARETDPAVARRRIGLVRMYWWFVVGVWPVLYMLVYQPWKR